MTTKFKFVHESQGMTRNIENTPKERTAGSNATSASPNKKIMDDSGKRKISSVDARKAYRKVSSVELSN